MFNFLPVLSAYTYKMSSDSPPWRRYKATSNVFLVEGKKKFLVPESTSSDKNAVANCAGPDENIHKEQSGQGLPAYTDSLQSIQL